MSVLIYFLVSMFACNAYEVVVAERDPLVVTTWSFKNAALKAWNVLSLKKGSALDAVEQGCTVCEYEQCDFTVGFGGSPDEKGETTLDSMIMCGDTMNVGGVAGLRRIKNAISVARRVLHNSKHSLLVGDAATAFAKDMGFSEENLTTPYSNDLYEKWLRGNCQPNHWVGVVPDPTRSCGPYSPKKKAFFNFDDTTRANGYNHDTIGMIAMDVMGSIASGTSTNGLIHKIPGRVGDSPIAGAGSYADSTIGAAASTGDGDLMMRFLPSFLAVEEMKKGATPTQAAWYAINRIKERHPNFFGAVVTLSKNGKIGAACNGMEFFPYYVGSSKGVIEHKINCA